jgi:hypothetical protein
MKRKSIQGFLVIGISFFILIFPAYQRHSSLTWVNLFPKDFSFENSDQGDQLTDQRLDEWRTLVSSAFLAIFLLRINHFEQTFCFSFPIFSLDQKTSILRC